MTDRLTLYKAISKIAYGFIFILVHIKIGPFDLLPDFVGYIMIIYAFLTLKDECKTILLLKPLGTVLAVWHTILYILQVFSITSFPFSSLINITVSIITIYFNFQLLTDLSLIAEKYQQTDEALDRKFIIRRNIYTICMTVIFIFSYITLKFHSVPEDIAVIITSIPGVISLIAMFLVVSALFSLRKKFRDNEPSQKNSPNDFGENTQQNNC